MEKDKILKADILDIIFDGKNKAYGAYQLRKTYNRTLSKALIITASVLLLIFMGSVLASFSAPDPNRRIAVADVEMVDVKPDEPLPPPPPPIVTPPPPPVINQVRFKPPVIVQDDEVKPEEVIEAIDDNQAISDQTIQSDNTRQIVQAPVEVNNTQVLEVPREDTENKIFTKVEKDAEFPGGDAQWSNYLSRNLNLDLPADNGASAGRHTVIVKFVVSKDGSLSDITCEQDPGFGMCAEAIRVIKKTNKWIPALQNGQHVNAYRRQPIVWVVE